MSKFAMTTSKGVGAAAVARNSNAPPRLNEIDVSSLKPSECTNCFVWCAGKYCEEPDEVQKKILKEACYCLIKAWPNVKPVLLRFSANRETMIYQRNLVVAMT